MAAAASTTQKPSTESGIEKDDLVVENKDSVDVDNKGSNQTKQVIGSALQVRPARTCYFILYSYILFKNS